MIQYQFDGNSNLVYTIIRKRNIFFNLINLPTDQASIDQIIDKKLKRPSIYSVNSTSMSQQQDKNNANQSNTKINEFNKTMEGAKEAKEAEPGTLKATLAEFPSVLNMTEKTCSNASNKNITHSNTNSSNDHHNLISIHENTNYNYLDSPKAKISPEKNNIIEFNHQSLITDLKNSSAEASADTSSKSSIMPSSSATCSASTMNTSDRVNLNSSHDDSANSDLASENNFNSPNRPVSKKPVNVAWSPTGEWVGSWKTKLPLQTIMRLLQVLVPQVEKICIDKGLTDESEIIKFLQNGTLVGLLPVPHPILIRKYQPNIGTIMWFRTYMWGVIYLR